MKHKGIAFICVLLAGGLMVLAYHAGANTNHLSAEDTNFNHLSADHHNRSLTQIMRDGAVDKVGKWIENHERRLVVLASNVAPYLPLTGGQMNFAKFKSTHYNNMLTQEMWDGLVSMLSIVAENHEMRLRKLEEKPVKQKEYACKGTYKREEEEWNRLPISDYHKRCYCRTDPGDGRLETIPSFVYSSRYSRNSEYGRKGDWCKRGYFDVFNKESALSTNESPLDKAFNFYEVNYGDAFIYISGFSFYNSNNLGGMTLFKGDHRDIEFHSCVYGILSKENRDIYTDNYPLEMCGKAEYPYACKKQKVSRQYDCSSIKDEASCSLQYPCSRVEKK